MKNKTFHLKSSKVATSSFQRKVAAAVSFCALLLHVDIANSAEFASSPRFDDIQRFVTDAGSVLAFYRFLSEEAQACGDNAEATENYKHFRAVNDHAIRLLKVAKIIGALRISRGNNSIAANLIRNLDELEELSYSKSKQDIAIALTNKNKEYPSIKCLTSQVTLRNSRATALKFDNHRAAISYLTAFERIIQPEEN